MNALCCFSFYESCILLAESPINKYCAIKIHHYILQSTFVRLNYHFKLTAPTVHTILSICRVSDFINLLYLFFFINRATLSVKNVFKRLYRDIHSVIKTSTGFHNYTHTYTLLNALKWPSFNTFMVNSGSYWCSRCLILHTLEAELHLYFSCQF